ncbi:MAG: DUF1194 domain-containing protein [Pseudomonadota bacterium]
MSRVLTFCAALILAATGAAAQCRQALVLALDVSGSVDSYEYRLQIEGLANALQHPEIRDALLAMPSAPIRIAVFEWSGPEHQRLLLNWKTVTTAAQIDSIAQQLYQTARSSSPPGTALGSAMQFGAALLAGQNECWKRTLDISGDGKHNQGPHPRDVKHHLARHKVTINALVIGADAPAVGDYRQSQVGELAAYFQHWVVVGPDGFVETALGFEDYESAMVRKLKRELEGLVLSALPAQ